jgi:glutamate racemase
MEASQPIGIFDSGIGGLTVAHAIKKHLHRESLIYFGDTAHLPYGDKSEAAVQAYSVKIADVLLQKNCKTIVIACNSASSAAYELLKEYVGSRALVVNVIDPMVDYVAAHYQNSRIGLIGTRRTIASGVYQQRISKLDQHIDLQSLATPLLVPMIEEGFFNNKISDEIIEKYLDDPDLKEITAIILGCTHYPLIRQQVNAFFNNQVDVLDSSDITARYLGKVLEEKQLLATSLEADDLFLVSDYTQSFEASTKLFFRERVELVKYTLWE